MGVIRKKTLPISSCFHYFPCFKNREALCHPNTLQVIHLEGLQVCVRAPVRVYVCLTYTAIF